MSPGRPAPNVIVQIAVRDVRHMEEVIDSMMPDVSTNTSMIWPPRCPGREPPAACYGKLGETRKSPIVTKSAWSDRRPHGQSPNTPIQLRRPACRQRTFSMTIRFGTVTVGVRSIYENRDWSFGIDALVYCCGRAQTAPPPELVAN